MSETTTMLGWHWLAEDRRLRYGTHEIVEVGGVYRAEGPLVMCRNGVHASRRALDALQYARGPIICRVELRGEILHDTDKSVARERRVLWLADATTMLHQFAVTVASDALHLVEASGKTVDPRLWKALEVKGQWLRGLATDEQLAAARAAAGAAARAAARAVQNTVLETMVLALEPATKATRCATP